MILPFCGSAFRQSAFRWGCPLRAAASPCSAAPRVLVPYSSGGMVEVAGCDRTPLPLAPLAAHSTVAVGYWGGPENRVYHARQRTPGLSPYLYLTHPVAGAARWRARCAAETPAARPPVLKCYSNGKSSRRRRHAFLIAATSLEMVLLWTCNAFAAAAMSPRCGHPSCESRTGNVAGRTGSSSSSRLRRQSAMSRRSRFHRRRAKARR